MGFDPEDEKEPREATSTTTPIRQTAQDVDARPPRQVAKVRTLSREEEFRQWTKGTMFEGAKFTDQGYNLIKWRRDAWASRAEARKAGGPTPEELQAMREEDARRLAKGIARGTVSGQALSQHLQGYFTPSTAAPGGPFLGSPFKPIPEELSKALKAKGIDLNLIMPNLLGVDQATYERMGGRALPETDERGLPVGYKGGSVGPNGEPLPYGAKSFDANGRPYYGPDWDPEYRPTGIKFIDVIWQDIKNAWANQVGWTEATIWGPRQSYKDPKKQLSQMVPEEEFFKGEDTSFAAYTQWSLRNLELMNNYLGDQVYNADQLPGVVGLASRIVHTLVKNFIDIIQVPFGRSEKYAIGMLINTLRGQPLDDAYLASRLLLTDTFIKKDAMEEFLERYHNGENPVLLGMELEHPLLEGLGEQIFDPGMYVGVITRVSGWKGFTSLTAEAGGAARLSPRVADALEYVRVTDITAAQRMEHLYPVVKDSWTSARNWIKGLATETGPNARLATAKVEFADELLDMAVVMQGHVGQGDAAAKFSQLQDALRHRIIVGAGPEAVGQERWMQSVMYLEQRPDRLITLSDLGHRQNALMAELFLEADGTLNLNRVAKEIRGAVDWAVEAAKADPKNLNAEAAFLEWFARRYRNKMQTVFPTVLERVEIGERIDRLQAAGKTVAEIPYEYRRFVDAKIPNWMVSAAKFDAKFGKIYNPINRMLASVFMGYNPGYAMRNMFANYLVIGVDRPMSLFRSTKATEQMYTRIFGRVPRKARLGFSQAAGLPTVAKKLKPGEVPKIGVRKWWQNPIMQWAEKIESNASMKIHGQAFEDFMRTNSKAAFGVLRRNLERSGVNSEDIAKLESLAKENDWDLAAAVEKFRSENPVDRRTLDFIDQATVDKLPYAVRERILDILRTTTSEEDFNQKWDRFLEGLSAEADGVKYERPILNDVGEGARYKEELTDLNQYIDDAPTNAMYDPTLDPSHIDYLGMKIAAQRELVEIYKDAFADVFIIARQKAEIAARTVDATSAQTDALKVAWSRLWDMQNDILRKVDDIGKAEYDKAVKLRTDTLRKLENATNRLERKRIWDQYFTAKDVLHVSATEDRISLMNSSLDNIQKMFPDIDDMAFRKAWSKHYEYTQLNNIDQEVLYMEGLLLPKQHPDFWGTCEAYGLRTMITDKKTGDAAVRSYSSLASSVNKYVPEDVMKFSEAELKSWMDLHPTRRQEFVNALAARASERGVGTIEPDMVHSSIAYVDSAIASYMVDAPPYMVQQYEKTNRMLHEIAFLEMDPVISYAGAEVELYGIPAYTRSMAPPGSPSRIIYSPTRIELRILDENEWVKWMKTTSPTITESAAQNTIATMGFRTGLEGKLGATPGTPDPHWVMNVRRSRLGQPDKIVRDIIHEIGHAWYANERRSVVPGYLATELESAFIGTAEFGQSTVEALAEGLSKYFLSPESLDNRQYRLLDELMDMTPNTKFSLQRMVNIATDEPTVSRRAMETLARHAVEPISPDLPMSDDWMRLARENGILDKFTPREIVDELQLKMANRVVFDADTGRAYLAGMRRTVFQADIGPFEVTRRLGPRGVARAIAGSDEIADFGIFRYVERGADELAEATKGIKDAIRFHADDLNDFAPDRAFHDLRRSVVGLREQATEFAENVAKRILDPDDPYITYISPDTSLENRQALATFFRDNIERWMIEGRQAVPREDPKPLGLLASGVSKQIIADNMGMPGVGDKTLATAAATNSSRRIYIHMADLMEMTQSTPDEILALLQELDPGYAKAFSDHWNTDMASLYAWIKKQKDAPSAHVMAERLAAQRQGDIAVEALRTGWTKDMYKTIRNAVAESPEIHAAMAEEIQAVLGSDFEVALDTAVFGTDGVTLKIVGPESRAQELQFRLVDVFADRAALSGEIDEITIYRPDKYWAAPPPKARGAHARGLPPVHVDAGFGEQLMLGNNFLLSDEDGLRFISDPSFKKFIEDVNQRRLRVLINTDGPGVSIEILGDPTITGRDGVIRDLQEAVDELRRAYPDSLKVRETKDGYNTYWRHVAQSGTPQGRSHADVVRSYQNVYGEVRGVAGGSTFRDADELAEIVRSPVIRRSYAGTEIGGLIDQIDDFSRPLDKNLAIKIERTNPRDYAILRNQTKRGVASIYPGQSHVRVAVRRESGIFDLERSYEIVSTNLYNPPGKGNVVIMDVPVENFLTGSRTNPSLAAKVTEDMGDVWILDERGLRGATNISTYSQAEDGERLRLALEHMNGTHGRAIASETAKSREVENMRRWINRAQEQYQGAMDVWKDPDRTRYHQTPRGSKFKSLSSTQVETHPDIVKYNYGLDDLERMGRGEGTFTAYHGTTEWQGKLLVEKGPHVPYSVVQMSDDVAKKYGLSDEWAEFLRGFIYEEYVDVLSAAPAPIATRWATGFRQGEKLTEINSNARIGKYAMENFPNMSPEDAYEAAYQVARGILEKTPLAHSNEIIADALEVADLYPTSGQGLLIAVDYPASKLADGIRGDIARTAELIRNNPDEADDILMYFNHEYRDFRLDPRYVQDPRIVEVGLPQPASWFMSKQAALGPDAKVADLLAYADDQVRETLNVVARQSGMTPEELLTKVLNESSAGLEDVRLEDILQQSYLEDGLPLRRIQHKRPTYFSVTNIMDDERFIAHSTGDAETLEQILVEGNKSRNFSGPGGQGEMGPFVILYDTDEAALMPVSHRPGDYEGVVASKPRAIVVDFEAFTEQPSIEGLVRQIDDMETEILDWNGGYFRDMDEPDMIDWSKFYDDVDKKHPLRSTKRRLDTLMNQLADIDDHDAYNAARQTQDKVFRQAQKLGEKHNVPVVRGYRDPEGMLHVMDQDAGLVMSLPDRTPHHYMPDIPERIAAVKLHNEARKYSGIQDSWRMYDETTMTPKLRANRVVRNGDPLTGKYGYMTRVTTDGKKFGVELLDCKNQVELGYFGMDQTEALGFQRYIDDLLARQGGPKPDIKQYYEWSVQAREMKARGNLEELAEYMSRTRRGEPAPAEKAYLRRLGNPESQVDAFGETVDAEMGTAPPMGQENPSPARATYETLDGRNLVEDSKDYPPGRDPNWVDEDARAAGKGTAKPARKPRKKPKRDVKLRRDHPEVLAQGSERTASQGPPRNETMRAALIRIRKSMKAYLDAEGATLPMGRAVSPAMEAGLSAWRGEGNQMFTKMLSDALSYAGETRDFALINYPDKRVFDIGLHYLYPYQFWYSRNYAHWMKRIYHKPWLIAAYGRYRDVLAKQHAGLPDWWKYQVELPIRLGNDKLFFNLEATLNPLNGITGVDFDDKRRRDGWLAATMDELGRWGPSIWAPITYGIAIERGLSGKPDEAAAWAQRLIPQANTLKSLTALMRLGPPGGIEVDPVVWATSGEWFEGMTIYEERQVARALYGLVEGGIISEAQAMDAARTHQGPYWEMAVQSRATGLPGDSWLTGKAIGQIMSSILGTGFRARSDTDVELDMAYSDMLTLMAHKPNMSPDEYRDKWNALHRRYPFFEVLLLSRKATNERDEAFVWNVISRIPPGQSDDFARFVGLQPELLDRFFEDKGNIYGDTATEAWPEPDRLSLMGGMTAIGALLGVPDTALKAEWEDARRVYRMMDKMILMQMGVPQDDVLLQAAEEEMGLRVNTYFSRLAEDSDLARAWLRDHPEVQTYLFLRDQLIMTDPILQKYYGGLDFIEGAWRREMYRKAEDLFGEDILDINAAFWDIRDKDGNTDRFLDDYPQLELYWDWLALAKGEIAKQLNGISNLLPDAPEAITRPDAIQNSVLTQLMMTNILESRVDDQISSVVDQYTVFDSGDDDPSASFSITEYIETEAEKTWPGVVDKYNEWRELAATNPLAAVAFYNNNDDVKQYNIWQKDVRSNYNKVLSVAKEGQAARTATSPTALAQELTWDDWTEVFRSSGAGDHVIRLTQDYVRKPSTGMSSELRDRLKEVWRSIGSPYGSFQKWLDALGLAYRGG